MRHIFAADIGGTHCRLAAFSEEQGVLTLTAVHTSPTANVPDTATLLQTFAQFVAPQDLPVGAPFSGVDMLAVAVAGPLHDTMRGSTTNAALTVDMHEALHAGCKQTLLCNDFAAQAWACCSSAMEQAMLVLPAEAAFNPDSAISAATNVGTNSDISPDSSPNASLDPKKNLWPVAVIGAGTGLGAASLVPMGGGSYCVAASEVGHTAFAFASQGPSSLKEKAYEAFLLHELGGPYVSAEDVVSGRGLCRLHRFLSGEVLPATVISAEHLHEDSPTRQYFARFLGRVCRNWALSTVCRGGLYVTGGVAMKNPALVSCPEFAQSFRESPTCAALLSSIPVYVNTLEASGLWGVATAGMQALGAEYR